MDETSPKGVNSVTTDKEEDIAQVFWENINENKCAADANLQSIVIPQRNVEKTGDMLEGKGSPIFRDTNFILETVDKRVPLGQDNSISRRPKVRDMNTMAKHLLEIDRGFKRMEQLCGFRGLSVPRKAAAIMVQQLLEVDLVKRMANVNVNQEMSVNRKSGASNTSKDVFSMRNLSEALPSTSNSEKKTLPLYKTPEMKSGRRPRATAANKSSSSTLASKLSSSAAMANKSSSSKTEPEARTLRKFSEGDLHKSPLGSSCIKSSDGPSAIRLDKKNFVGLSKREKLNAYLLATRLQARIDRNIAGLDRVLRMALKARACRDLKTSGQLKFCPEFAKMSLDDQKKTTDAEKLSPLRQNVAWLSLDSGGHQTTDSQNPALFNDPGKGDADQEVSIDEACERS